jgi:hypothetical protein
VTTKVAAKAPPMATVAVKAKRVLIEEVVDEPKMAEYNEADRNVEDATVAYLKGLPLEEIYVPGNISPDGYLQIIYNGTRWSYKDHASHFMPSALAEIARARINAVPKVDWR